MNALVKEIIGRAELWSPEDQEELAQAALEIELRRGGKYQATADEIAAVDAAIAALRQGDLAAEADIDSLLAKHRT